MLDDKEFKSFFQEHFESVFQFARKYTMENDDARDIAQESFIKLYEKRADVDCREKAKSFVYITARNLCLDYLKHKKIKSDYARTVLEETEESEEQFFTEEVTYQETLRLLHAAIDRLPPQTKAVILAGLEGKNNTEIADALHVSVNSVKTLKKNAYKLLRELIEKYRALLLLLSLG